METGHGALDVVLQAAQLDMAVLQHRIAGTWVAVPGLTEAAGIGHGRLAHRRVNGEWVWPTSTSVSTSAMGPSTSSHALSVASEGT